MGNKNPEERVVLYEDADILDVEAGLRPRVDAFLRDLEIVERLHPHVVVRSRVDESSFIIAVDEDGADNAMQEEDYDVTLDALAEAADHRGNPRIDVLVVCETDKRRELLSVFQTIDLYAGKHGGTIFRDGPIRSNETGTTFEFLGEIREIPYDGRPKYSKARVYRFSKSS